MIPFCQLSCLYRCCFSAVTTSVLRSEVRQLCPPFLWSYLLYRKVSWHNVVMILFWTGSVEMKPCYLHGQIPTRANCKTFFCDMGELTFTTSTHVVSVGRFWSDASWVLTDDRIFSQRALNAVKIIFSNLLVYIWIYYYYYEGERVIIIILIVVASPRPGADECYSLI